MAQPLSFPAFQYQLHFGFINPSNERLHIAHEALWDDPAFACEHVFRKESGLEAWQIQGRLKIDGVIEVPCYSHVFTSPEIGDYLISVILPNHETARSPLKFAGMTRREYFDRCLLSLGRRLYQRIGFDYAVVGEEAMIMGEIGAIQKGRIPEERLNSYLMKTNDGLLEVIGNTEMEDKEP